MERRTFLKAASALAAGPLPAAMAQASPPAVKRNAKLKQSVTNGALGGGFAAGGGEELENNCKLAASLGFKGYDFVNPDSWPILKKYGLVPSMIYAVARTAAPAGAGRGAGGGAAGGQGAAGRAGGQAAGAGGGGRGPAQPPQPSGMQLNNPAHHEEQEKLLHTAIDQAAAGGAPAIIVFSGSQPASAGMSAEAAADNCVAILNRVKAHAEDKAINLSMEYLSNAGNYLGPIGKLAWGTEVMKRVNSPRVGILLDIWHVQLVEGDVVRRIRDNIQWINHFHTAGNPGRNQLDDNQELNYRFIARAIADLNYSGFIGHEYRPTQGADPVECLKQAFDVFNL
jgi:hydroxypyruvate isomerase